MSQKLTGKVAIVTGASTGISTLIASHLAKKAAVVVSHSSGKEGAQKIAAGIIKSGLRVIVRQANVADLANAKVIQRLFSKVPRGTQKNK